MCWSLLRFVPIVWLVEISFPWLLISFQLFTFVVRAAILHFELLIIPSLPFIVLAIISVLTALIMLLMRVRRNSLLDLWL